MVKLQFQFQFLSRVILFKLLFLTSEVDLYYQNISSHIIRSWFVEQNQTYHNNL